MGGLFLIIFTFWESAFSAPINLNLSIGDVTPPANVTGFTATAGYGQITLSWTNPPDADFQGVKIQRKTTGYPTGPNDGTNVYNSNGTSYLDPGLTGGVRYYYTAFSYDAEPNYASGAIATAMVLTSGSAKTPTPSPAASLTATEEYIPAEEVYIPSVTTPGPTVQPTPTPAETPGQGEIKFSDFDVFFKVDSGWLKSQRLDNYYFFTDQEIRLSIDEKKFFKKVTQIILTIGESSYLLNLENGLYEAIIITPESSGNYQIIINILYFDSTYQKITLKAKVEERGLVFQKSFWQRAFAQVNSRPKGIAGVNISLYYFNQDNHWELWPAEQYKQENPQNTDSKGQYNFLVPKGKYYLFAQKEGYYNNKTKEFEVDNQIVNKEIELKPVIKPWVWLLGLIVFLALGFLILRKSGRLKIKKRPR